MALLQGMVLYAPIATLYRQVQGGPFWKLPSLRAFPWLWPSFFLFCGLSAGSCLVLALTAQVLPSVLGILTLRLSNTLFQSFQLKIQNRQIQTENRATCLSIHSMLISCVVIGTNLSFGVLSGWWFPAAFLFGAAICILGLGFFLIWYRNAARAEN